MVLVGIWLGGGFGCRFAWFVGLGFAGFGSFVRVDAI